MPDRRSTRRLRRRLSTRSTRLLTSSRASGVAAGLRSLMTGPGPLGGVAVARNGWRMAILETLLKRWQDAQPAIFAVAKRSVGFGATQGDSPPCSNANLPDNTKILLLLAIILPVPNARNLRVSASPAARKARKRSSRRPGAPGADKSSSFQSPVIFFFSEFLLRRILIYRKSS
jgi:hypothetical protein